MLFSVSLVLNWQTGHVLPQFHTVLDNYFGTVPFMRVSKLLLNGPHLSPRNISTLRTLIHRRSQTLGTSLTWNHLRPATSTEFLQFHLLSHHRMEILEVVVVSCPVPKYIHPKQFCLQLIRIYYFPSETQNLPDRQFPREWIKRNRIPFLREQIKGKGANKIKGTSLSSGSLILKEDDSRLHSLLQPHSACKVDTSLSHLIIPTLINLNTAGLRCLSQRTQPTVSALEYTDNNIQNTAICVASTFTSIILCTFSTMDPAYKNSLHQRTLRLTLYMHHLAQNIDRTKNMMHPISQIFTLLSDAGT